MSSHTKPTPLSDSQISNQQPETFTEQKRRRDLEQAAVIAAEEQRKTFIIDLPNGVPYMDDDAQNTSVGEMDPETLAQLNADIDALDPENIGEDQSRLNLTALEDFINQDESRLNLDALQAAIDAEQSRLNLDALQDAIDAPADVSETVAVNTSTQAGTQYQAPEEVIVLDETPASREASSYETPAATNTPDTDLRVPPSPRIIDRTFSTPAAAAMVDVPVDDPLTDLKQALEAQIRQYIQYHTNKENAASYDRHQLGRGRLSFFLHGEKGIKKARELLRTIQAQRSMDELRSFLIDHFSERHMNSAFNRLHNHSLDPYLLDYLLKEPSPLLFSEGFTLKEKSHYNKEDVKTLITALEQRQPGSRRTSPQRS